MSSLREQKDNEAQFLPLKGVQDYKKEGVNMYVYYSSSSNP